MIEELVKSKKVFLFDFDGVLVDSVEIKTTAFAHLYQNYGSEVVENVINFHRENGGMSRFDKFKYFHNNFLNQNINSDEIDDLADKFSDFVVESVIKAPIIGCSEDFLKKVCDDELDSFVVSATPQKEIEEIVQKRNWNMYFKGIYGSPTSKAKNIDKILIKNKSYQKKDCIFFGDALSDLNAAQSHRIDFIGIDNQRTHIFKKRVKKDFLFPDFTYLNSIM